MFPDSSPNSLAYLLEKVEHYDYRRSAEIMSAHNVPPWAFSHLLLQSLLDGSNFGFTVAIIDVSLWP